MKPKSLKLHVSEVTPNEMKQIITSTDNNVSGCSALANCANGGTIICITEIPNANCYTMQTGLDGHLQDVGVVCAGVVSYCSGAEDSGTNGSGGGEVPSPTPPTAKKL